MLIDLIGWIGAILILLAYYLVSSKRASGDSIVYQVLNLVGAIAIVIMPMPKELFLRLH